MGGLLFMFFPQGVQVLLVPGLQGLHRLFELAFLGFQLRLVDAVRLFLYGGLSLLQLLFQLACLLFMLRF